VNGRLKVGDQDLPLGPVMPTVVGQFGEPPSFDLLAWTEGSGPRSNRALVGLGRFFTDPIHESGNFTQKFDGGSRRFS